MSKKHSSVIVFVIIFAFVFISVLFPCTCAIGEEISWTGASNGLPTSGTYLGVTFSDINNDGNLDIVAASDGEGLRVFLGDGAGSWVAVSSHPATSGGFGGVAVGDYDGDGDNDLFAGSPGNGASTPTGLHVYRGDGMGGFTEITASTTLPSSGKWRGVAVGDVNNDGNLDLAATNGYGSSDGIHVFTGDGTGTFTDNSNGLPIDQSRDSSVVLADFNNDGDLDLAAGGSPGVAVYIGNGGNGGSMSWTSSSSGLPSERFTGVKTADVDNDGLMDIVLSSYNAGSGFGMRAYKNVNNAASWTSMSTGLPTSGDYIELSAGDFNNDGNIDMASGGVLSPKGIEVYFGDGSGSWTMSSEGLPTTNDRVGNDVGDMNGDGKLDIVIGRYGGGGIEVWENMQTDTSPPNVISTSPADSAANVPLNAGISITLSKPMNRVATEGAITFSPSISMSFSWSNGDRVILITPSSNLDESTRYTIMVGTAAMSADGINLESSYDFSFTTGSDVDSTPPTVVSTNPANNAAEVESTTQITLTFSESMDTTVTESAVSISPGLITDRAWDSTGKVLTLTVALEDDIIYTVSISNNAQDFAGNNIGSGYSFSFTTKGEEEQTNEGSGLGTQQILLILIPIVAVVLILVVLMLRKKK